MSGKIGLSCAQLLQLLTNALRRLDQASVLASLFLVYGMLAVLTWAVVTPPFQNVDEVSHLMRAEAVSRLVLVSPHEAVMPAPPNAKTGIYASAAPMSYVRADPAHRVTTALLDAAGRVGWGLPVPGGYANTAVYPPFLYGPASVTIKLSKVTGFSVTRTLYAARLVTGAVAVTLAFGAVALAGPAAPVLFAMLALPMTFALMGSPSQDAIMLPLAAFLAALMVRVMQAEFTSRRAFVGICVGLTVIAAARPPYACLGLLMLILPGPSLTARTAGAAIVGAVAIGWSLIAANVTGLLPLPGTDAPAQFRGVVADPIRALLVPARTLWLKGGFLAKAFIGILGWLDVELPHWFYPLAWAQLIVAAGLVASRLQARPLPWSDRAWSGLAAFGSVAGIFTTQYLACTPPGAPVVDGLQGRYFLPIALLLVTQLPGLPVPRPGSSLRLLALVLVVGFPLLSIVVTTRALVLRYYLT